VKEMAAKTKSLALDLGDQVFLFGLILGLILVL